MKNMYSIDIWYLGSNLITPEKKTSSSAQLGVGSDDDYFPLREGRLRAYRWMLGQQQWQQKYKIMT